MAIKVKDANYIFNKFNKEEVPFSSWVKGSFAITKMQKNNFPKWRETEWPGWYLEFMFDAFLSKKNIGVIVYHGKLENTNDHLDFDLAFPTHKFYGDLKASDITQDVSPGNDKESVVNAINRYDRFWYVIYEHETVKDKNCGNEITRFRSEFIRQVTGDEVSPLSYANRMKNRICFKKMMIIELNRANCGDLLSDFHQGHQPDGSARAPKVKINKRNIENYQVFHYEVEV